MLKDIEMFSEFATSGRVVVFDTETTGGSCSDEICQLAAAEYVNGRLERTMNVYIRPTCEMNPWAEQIHGISTSMASIRWMHFSSSSSSLVRTFCLLHTTTDSI